MNFLRRSSRSQLFSSLIRPSCNRFTRISRTRTCRYTPPHHDYHSGSATRWYRRLISVGAAVIFYYWNLETVPYTNRRHFVPTLPFLDRFAGEINMALLKYELGSKILPPEHVDSVRVSRVFSRLLSAVERGLGNVEPVIEDGSEVMLNAPMDKTLVEKAKASWSQKHPRQVKWDWEVIVVKDDDKCEAQCRTGGKIVMFTGMLHNLHTDAEIATIIGHEVGHAIAKHTAEVVIKDKLFSFLHFVLLQFISIWPDSISPDSISKMADVLLPCLWNREFEANHIGLFVLAAAGYDPRVAPRLFDRFHRKEMLGKYLDVKALRSMIFGCSAHKDHLDKRPSFKKQAEMIRRAEVMEEALQMYQKSIARYAHEDGLQRYRKFIARRGHEATNKTGK